MEEAFSIETSLTAERSGAAVVTQVAEAPARVRTFVEGLDETLEGGVPWGHVVLIEAPPGTWKWSPGFSIFFQTAPPPALNCFTLIFRNTAPTSFNQWAPPAFPLKYPNDPPSFLIPR